MKGWVLAAAVWLGLVAAAGWWAGAVKAQTCGDYLTIDRFECEPPNQFNECTGLHFPPADPDYDAACTQGATSCKTTFSQCTNESTCSYDAVYDRCNCNQYKPDCWEGGGGGGGGEPAGCDATRTKISNLRIYRDVNGNGLFDDGPTQWYQSNGAGSCGGWNYFPGIIVRTQNSEQDNKPFHTACTTDGFSIPYLSGKISDANNVRNFAIWLEGIPAGYVVSGIGGAAADAGKCFFDGATGKAICNLDGCTNSLYFLVKSTPPTCSLSPAGNATVAVGSTSTYTATCSDADAAITKCRVLYNSTSASNGAAGWTYKSCNSSPCAFPITWDTVGSYYITADAQDSGGTWGSGNPWCEWAPNPPSTLNCNASNTYDCGNSDVYTVTVVTPTPTPALPCPTPALQVPDQECDAYNNRDIDFDWNNIAGTSRYQWQVDNESTFSSPILAGRNDIPISEHIWEDVSSYGPRYARVRAYESTSCSLGPWSAVRSFTVSACPTPTPGPCPAPLMDWPSVVCVDGKERITWDWNDVPNASEYRFRLDDSNPQVAPYLGSSLTTESARTPADQTTGVVHCGQSQVNALASVSPSSCTVPGNWSNVTCESRTCPSPTPTIPPNCIFNLVPATLTRVVGGTAGIQGVPQPTGGTVSSVNFFSSNISVAQVNPGSDISSPYNSTVSCVAGGNATITGRCMMSGVTRGSDTTAVSCVTPTPTPVGPTNTPTRTPTPGPTNTPTRTPTPAPCNCTVNLVQAAPASIPVGGTTAFQANPSITGGACTVDEVLFSSAPAGIVSLSRAVDASSPYTSTATGQASGSTTVTSQVRLTDGVIHCSDSSVQVVANATPTPTPTCAPINPPASVNVNDTGGNIRVNWTDSSTNETGFNVYRREGANPYAVQPGMPLAANTTSWNDPGETCGVTYSYGVTALLSTAPPGCSNESSMTTGIGGCAVTAPWFQVGGGGNAIAAAGDVGTGLPPGAPPPYLVESGTGGIPGLAVGTGLYRITGSNVSSKGWAVDLTGAWSAMLARTENKYPAMRERLEARADSYSLSGTTYNQTQLNNAIDAAMTAGNKITVSGTGDGGTPAPTAITAVETVSGGWAPGDPGTGNSFTLGSWTPAAGDLVLLAVGQRDESRSVTASGNGITFTQIMDVNNDQGNNGLVLLRGMNTSPASGPITVTVTGNTLPVSAIATRFSGVDTSGTNGSGAVEAVGFDDGPSSAEGDNANMKANLTTQTSGAWAFAAGTHRTRNLTVPSGETGIAVNVSRGAGGDVTNTSTWYESTGGAGTVTVGADNDLSGVTDWVVAAASLKPAAAGGPTPTPAPGPTVEVGLVKRAGDVTLSGNIDVGSRKVIMLVDGNVTINGNVNLTDDQGFLAVIAGGNITVDAAVGEATYQSISPPGYANPHLEGIFYAQGTFDTGTVGGAGTDRQLRVDGTVIGMNGVSLRRNVSGVYPAEYFNFRPDLTVTLNQVGLRRKTTQEMVAP